MVSALFLAVGLLAFGVAGHRWWLHRRDPKPTRPPMIVILLALGCAFVFLAPAVQAVESRIVPSLGRLLSNVSTLVAAFGFLNLMLYVSHPAEQVRARTRPRLVALLAALLVMVVTFVATRDLPTGTGLFTGLYRSHPTLALYVLAYSVYLGVALVDLAWIALHAVRYTRRYLRVGMAVLAVGCLLGLSYVAQKVVSVAGEMVGRGPAEAFCTGPFATVGCTFAVGMPALSVLAIIVGGVIPPLGPRVETAVRWLGRWRAYRRLGPLWRALYDAVPEIALTSPHAVQGRIPRRDMAFRLYRRVIEIRDGLLVLHPYRDPDTDRANQEAAEQAGLRGDGLAAAVEAADIAAALRRRRSGEPATETGAPADRQPGGEPADLAAETAWLVRVSTAFARVEQAPEVASAPTG